MKHLFTAVLILCLPLVSLAQQVQADPPKPANEFLLKSKKQKRTGFIMLGAGGAAFIAGSVIWLNNVNFVYDTGNASYPGIALALAGGASMLGSIPFFIASSKNKKKGRGMAAGVTMRSLPAGPLGTHYPAAYPSISLRLDLGSGN